MRRDLGQRQRVDPGRKSDNSARMLAETLVGRGDDRQFGNPGHGSQCDLDLGGRDVLATADDDVLGAIGDGETAEFVEYTDVSRAVPTIGIEHVVQCRIGIAEAQVGTPREDLTRHAHRHWAPVFVEQFHLHAGQRWSVGSVADIGRIGEL